MLRDMCNMKVDASRVCAIPGKGEHRRTGKKRKKVVGRLLSSRAEETGMKEETDHIVKCSRKYQGKKKYQPSIAEGAPGVFTKRMV